MKKRNIILLIIITATITIGYIWYSNFTQTNTNTQTEDSNPKFNFFPFGETKKNIPQITDTSTENTNENTNEVIVENTNALKKVSSMPIAGYGIFNKEVYKEIAPVEPVPVAPTFPTKNSKTKKVLAPIAPATELIPTLRYVDKVTGNIYQSTVSNLDERKFTDTIIPQIYEAFWSNNGSNVVLRYLKNVKNIQSFLGSLPKDVLGADAPIDTILKGTFLPEDITDMSISPDGKNMFYVFNTNDSAVGIVASADGTKKTQVFNSSFTEWLSSWSNNKTITLTTKPGYNVDGYMYSINIDKKDFTKIIGGINGLTTLTNPTNSKVLYSISKNGSLALNIYDIQTMNTISLGAKTLPEKCVWTKTGDYLYCAVPKYLDNANYPDAWYQGLISFGDEIWKIDATNGSATKIIDPATIAGQEIDAVKLSLSDSEDYLFFINKKDSYLWELNLK